MTIRYDNFKDQVKKFGVQFIFLVSADENFGSDKRNESGPFTGYGLFVSVKHSFQKKPKTMP